MSYIEENLIPDEKILYQCKLHWVVFLWPIIWLIVAVVIFLTAGHWAILGGSVIAAIAVFKAIESFITYSSSEFGVTNYRVIAKVGFIRRKSLEVLLSKIEGIRVSQTVLGRILGYGSITISGTGGTHDLFPYISDFLEFRGKIQEQIVANQSTFRSAWNPKIPIWRYLLVELPAKLSAHMRSSLPLCCLKSSRV